MIRIALVFLGFLVVLTFSAPARAQPLCPGLTGAARTACLRQERDRTAAIAARDNAYLESLNRSVERACRAADAADMAAAILAEGRQPQVMWAGRVWISARALGMAAARSRDECGRMQQQREQMRRRR